jgi:hypothetical protein
MGNFPPAHLELLDVDRDNDLDFLAAYELLPQEIRLIRSEAGAWIDPEGEVVSAGRSVLGVAAGDLDHDGYPEILLPSNGESPTALAANVIAEPAFDQVFVEVEDAAGFDDQTANVKTLAMADFDNDGDLDVFLGLNGDVAHGRVRKAAGVDGDAAVAGQWLALELIGAEDNLSAIGAEVSLSDAVTGVPLGWQQVSGRGARSGQPSRRLLFGLKGQENAVEARIVWPLGRVQTEVIQPSGFGQIHEIDQEVSYDIDPSSIAFTMVVDPWVIDWRFVWYTDHWTEPTADRVYVTDPNMCLTQTYTIQPGPGVDHYVTYEPSVSGVRYRHEMVLNDAPCVPGCRFAYSVSSDNYLWPGGPVTVTAPNLAKMPLMCPKTQ